MKLKRLFCIICAVAMLSSVMTGCGKKGEVSDEPSTSITETSSSKKRFSSTMTVKELKEKYGETDENRMLPLYNLDAHEPIVLDAGFNLWTADYEGDDLPADICSIHTDEKCLEESSVFVNKVIDDCKLEIKPSAIMPLKVFDADDISNWGNVPIYYLKLNYDISGSEPVKYKTPKIVPVTLKAPVDAPRVDYRIDNGSFVLTWDKVPGATGYKIYNRRTLNLFETKNDSMTGKEQAYKGNNPTLIGEVDGDTFEFRDFADYDSTGRAFTVLKDGDKELITGVNEYVNGDYYVTAVKGDKESLFSVEISTTKLDLPARFADDSKVYFSTFESPDDLPTHVNILYIDGSVHKHKVSYECGEVAYNTAHVYMKVEGTELIVYVNVKNWGDTEIDSVESIGEDMEESVTGRTEIEDNIPQVPEKSMPTINEDVLESIESNRKGEDKTEADKKDSDKQEKVNEEEDDEEIDEDIDEDSDEDDSVSVVTIQEEVTEKVLEEANKEEFEVSDEFVINASSAAEEYLVMNMIAGKKEISLAAFPELQNWYSLIDVLQAVTYQNPLILGVRSYGYDYSNMMLLLEYDYTADEMAKYQEEIMEKGKEIIKDIIDNDMSDEEKRDAIYKYLEENTKYDDAALENAEKNNFEKVDDSFRHSFSTYGILVKGVGVCQSYAYAYDYLCELADVECIVVTGYIQGNLPHAWNKVKIGDEWFVIDVTNNSNIMGIDYFMYENPDNIAEKLSYTEDDSFYKEAEVGVYVGKSTKHSKYKDSLVNSKDEIVEFINDNYKEGTKLEFIAMYDNFEMSDVTDALRETSVREVGKDSIVVGNLVVLSIVK